MKKLISTTIAAVFVLTLGLAGKATAVPLADLDPLPGGETCADQGASMDQYYWDATWGDELWDRVTDEPYTQTTYTLRAPCKVYIDEEFEVRTTVIDSFWTYTDVAGTWWLRDTPDGSGYTTIDSGSYFTNTIRVDGTGTWTNLYPITYTGAPVNHQMDFYARDFGYGSGGMGWGGQTVGNIIVDPFRTSNEDTTPPELDPTVDLPVIWPPKGKHHEVVVMANATDDSDGPISLDASISCDEDDCSRDYSIDSIDEVNGLIYATVKAKRKGHNKDGRTYTVSVTATDEAGNSTTDSVDIWVPQNQSTKKHKDHKKHKKHKKHHKKHHD